MAFYLGALIDNFIAVTLIRRVGGLGRVKGA